MFPDDAGMVFCIGAQKAGTTWLYHALSQSAEVHFSPNKGLHYFDVMSGKAQQVLDLRVNAASILAQRLVAKPGRHNLATLQQLRDMSALLTIYTGEPGIHDAYLSYLLDDYRGQKRVCDITPAYAVLNADTFREMGQIGRSQFLFILRDPVDRLWSQIRMAVSVAGTPDPDFQAACEARLQLLLSSNRLPKIERADFQRTMTQLEQAIPRRRIMYLFYETLFRQETVLSLCTFLGIAPLEIQAKQRSNKGKGAHLPAHLRQAARIALAPQYMYINERFGSDLPEEWHMNLDVQARARE